MQKFANLVKTVLYCHKKRLPNNLLFYINFNQTNVSI